MKKILLIVAILLGFVLIYKQSYFERKPSPEFLQTLKLAKQGNAEAQLTLGQMYYKGRGVKQDHDEALMWFLASKSYDNIEKMKEEGIFVPKCEEERWKWIKKMAEKGNAEAQHGISTMYYNGIGVEQNYEEALKWAEKSAKQGHLASQYNLGGIYYYGEVVEQDYEKALKWLKLATEQGHEEAIDLIKKIEEKNKRQ